MILLVSLIILSARILDLFPDSNYQIIHSRKILGNLKQTLFISWSSLIGVTVGNQYLHLPSVSSEAKVKNHKEDDIKVK